jgi:hypothetical protein
VIGSIRCNKVQLAIRDTRALREMSRHRNFLDFNLIERSNNTYSTGSLTS